MKVGKEKALFIKSIPMIELQGGNYRVCPTKLTGKSSNFQFLQLFIRI